MKHFTYVINLLKFAFGENKLLYANIILSLLSVAIELLAMSSLLPLFEIVSGNKSAASGYAVEFLTYFNIPIIASSLLWCFIALFTLRIFTLVTVHTVGLFLGKRVLAQLGSKAFNQIVHHISLSEINKKSIGFYTSLAGDEAFRASTLIVTLSQFVSTAALSILYFSAIAIFSPNTAFMIIIFLCLCAIVLFRILRKSHQLGSEQIEQSRRTNTTFIDGINNLKAVRAFNAEGYVSGIYKNNLYGYTKTLFLIDEIALLTKFIPIILLIACLAILFFFKPDIVTTVGIASIVTMIVFLMRFFPTVGQAVVLLLKIVSDAKSGKDVTAIISHHQADHDGEAKMELVENISSITLDKVSFCYPNTEQYTFRNISYQFLKSHSYAIVGPSGTGKSTLIDLLLEFLMPTQGRVLFNNIDSIKLNAALLRQRVLLITQEPAIFDDTVLNNIYMGKQTDIEEVKAACKIACIDDVIESMESGYDTRLQYQGKNLSGGQRQRIAIARALLRNPDVLILDESTSALDKQTQETVVSNILASYKDKIVIFVTHDPVIAGRVDHVFDLSLQQ